MGISKTNGLVRIAMAEDDLSILQLVSKHIDTLENCKVVIKTAEGQELLDKLKENPGVEIVILDIVMDGLDGYNTAAILRKEYPEIKILFYSVCTEHFKKGIKTLLKGNYYYPDGETGYTNFANGSSGDILSKPTLLSALELTFLQYAITELTYKQIAYKMDKELRQVDYIREGLFKKLQVQSRVGLAILALQSGIMPKQV